jgi:hypothetical protein
MPEADAETRSRLYSEYLALDDEYRKLADKLKPFTITAENRVGHRQLFDIGRSLEAKLHELQEASNIRRATPRPGSGF